MRKDDLNLHVFQNKNLAQNLSIIFFSNFDCQRTFSQERFQVKKNGVTGLISEKSGSFVCGT